MGVIPWEPWWLYWVSLCSRSVWVYRSRRQSMSLPSCRERWLTMSVMTELTLGLTLRIGSTVRRPVSQLVWTRHRKGFMDTVISVCQECCGRKAKSWMSGNVKGCGQCVRVRPSSPARGAVGRLRYGLYTPDVGVYSGPFVLIWTRSLR